MRSANTGGPRERSARCFLRRRGSSPPRRGIFFTSRKTSTSDDLDHFFKIVSYYGYPKNFKKMDWYLNEGDRVPLSSLTRHEDNSLEARYASMLKLLRKHNIDPIVIGLSPQQMPQMRLVKVVCPELTPPYVQNMPMLGSRRYFEVPEKLGWRNRPTRLTDLNLDPQPYP